MIPYDGLNLHGPVDNLLDNVKHLKFSIVLIGIVGTGIVTRNILRSDMLVATAPGRFIACITDRTSRYLNFRYLRELTAPLLGESIPGQFDQADDEHEFWRILNSIEAPPDAPPAQDIMPWLVERMNQVLRLTRSSSVGRSNTSPERSIDTQRLYRRALIRQQRAHDETRTSQGPQTETPILPLSQRAATITTGSEFRQSPTAATSLTRGKQSQ